MKTWLPRTSFLLAIAAVIFLLVTPAYTGFDGSRATQATVLQVNGRHALVPMLFSAIVALMSLIFPTREVRIFAAVLMCGFTLLGAFTIGLLYLPAAIVMLIAASTTPDASTPSSI